MWCGINLASAINFINANVDCPYENILAFLAAMNAHKKLAIAFIALDICISSFSASLLANLEKFRYSAHYVSMDPVLILRFSFCYRFKLITTNVVGNEKIAYPDLV